MASKLISFAHRIDGVLTDATSVKLRDSVSAPAYGLRLAASPFTVVVAAGTNLTHDGTGLYSVTATGLTGGAEYQYALEWVYGGETKRQVRTFTAAAATASGFWWTLDQLKAQWGDINTDVAGALDGVASVATIQAVGDAVDADVDRALRVWGYARPTPSESDDYAVVSRMAVDVLHWRLENRRGQDKTAGAREDAREQEQAVWDELDEMLQGATAYQSEGIDFPRISATPVVTAPAAVYPTVDRDGRTVTAGNLGYGARWDAAAGVWRNW